MHPPIYTFVTDGVVSAIDQAKQTAGDKVVHLHGARVMQQALPLGLVPRWPAGPQRESWLADRGTSGQYPVPARPIL